MLILYQSEGCPYCGKVREKMSELGLSYVAHNPRLPGNEGGDVTNREAYEEMTALAEEDAIPFLIDMDVGKRIGESDDILEHLEEHYG